MPELYIGRKPVSAAMTGTYRRAGNMRGIWKLPADVSIIAAGSPAVHISARKQDDLNIPSDGKSVHVIRTMILGRESSRN